MIEAHARASSTPIGRAGQGATRGPEAMRPSRLLLPNEEERRRREKKRRREGFHLLCQLRISSQNTGAIPAGRI